MDNAENVCKEFDKLYNKVFRKKISLNLKKKFC